MLAFLVSLVIYISLYLIWYRRKKNLPPGPRGIPLFGVLPFLGQHPAKRMYEWSKKYGSVFTVRMGEMDYVVINDYDSMQQVHIKQADKSCGRPPIFIFDSFAAGNGVMFANQRVWHVHRPFSALTLRRLGMGGEKMEEIIMTEGQFVMQSLRNTHESAFDPKDLLFCAIMNIIFRILFGERCDYDDEEFQEYARRSVKCMQHPVEGKLVQLMFYTHYVRWVPPFMQAFNHLRDDYEHLCSMFRRKIREHSESYDPNDIRDFIDAFLEESKKEDRDKTFCMEQLVFTLKDILFAGTEAPPTTLIWSILVMVTYPEYKKKLQEEIDAVIGHREASMSHRTSLPYTMAFIYEVMRCYTEVPLTHTRLVDEVVANGTTIPKNTPVLTNIWSVHNDPKNFENPSEFRPERFINPKDGSFVSSRYWIPYGIGKRYCMGEPLANSSVFLLLVTMLQQFDIVADEPSSLPSLDDGMQGILYISKRFKVKFIPR